MPFFLKCAVVVVAVSCSARLCAESLWIEAEHLSGIQGYCWPMGKPEMRQTKGAWGISGPGWAAEWNQGGESAFMSIACGAEDDKAIVTRDIEVPSAGKYFVWVRYRDAREMSDRFQVKLEQAGQHPWTATYGERPVIEEDNEMKLYWNWAFGWEAHAADLKAGVAKLSLLSFVKEPDCRQIDCIVLTTDEGYRPLIKERPAHPTWALLDEYRKRMPGDVRPLARRVIEKNVTNALPAAWQPKTFNDRGFLYLWNIKDFKWATGAPGTVSVPYQIGDAETASAFEKKYASLQGIPIFGDSRIVPSIHGTALNQALATDSSNADEKAGAEAFCRWLDANPLRAWASMMNYAPDVPMTAAAKTNFHKYRDRFVGRIAGESLGYFDGDVKGAAERLGPVKTRRQFANEFSKLALEANAAKWQKVFCEPVEPTYREIIPCQSIENAAFTPLAFQWGARTVGYESSAMTAGMLGMRLAFLRGIARQFGGMTATYRSCNFGDSSTIFSETARFNAPKHILDNYYSVFSGAGMTWYKMDIWHQYMSGASMFYHEQGFDEYWMPGGTTAAGQHEVQLSPKGKLVDRFLRTTAKGFDRGAPWTPIAFLVDYAHGWEPSPFSPRPFGNHADHAPALMLDDHDQMLHEYFWTAYHPIVRKSEQPITGTSEVYVPGVFGDIFDVICAYPDVSRWTTIDTYPVVIVAGDVELTEAEGQRLAKYIADGGTALIASGQLSGPGAAVLQLPELGAREEAEGYQWQGEAPQATQRYRYQPIQSGQSLAQTESGKTICASFDRGAGRLIYLSVPRGLGIDRTALPIVPWLFLQLSRGLMPVYVEGDVEWLVNKTTTGWAVTLLNPAGQDKPQQGIVPTDYSQNKLVTILTDQPVAKAFDRLLPSQDLPAEDSRITCEVPAGGVKIIDIR